MAHSVPSYIVLFGIGVTLLSFLLLGVELKGLVMMGKHSEIQPSSLFILRQVLAKFSGLDLNLLCNSGWP